MRMQEASGSQRIRRKGLKMCEHEVFKAGGGRGDRGNSGTHRRKKEVAA